MQREIKIQIKKIIKIQMMNKVMKTQNKIFKVLNHKKIVLIIHYQLIANNLMIKMNNKKTKIISYQIYLKKCLKRILNKNKQIKVNKIVLLLIKNN